MSRDRAGGAERERIEAIATELVDSAIRVHRELGPGLLESTYQVCFAYELRSRGLEVAREVTLPIHYAGVSLVSGYRIDMVVSDAVLVENKSVHELHPIHLAQMLTYLKLSNRHLGFLINWNVHLLKHGIKRLVNGL